MKKNILTLLMVCAAMMSIVIAGCGSSGSSNPSSATDASKMVFGVALLDTTADGTVTVKDSSVPVREKTAAIGSKGAYTIDVAGFKPPFLLKAAWTDQAGARRMYSASAKGGRTNINPLSDAAVTAAADGRDRDELYERRDHDEDSRTAYNFEKVIDSLRTVLAPLFAQYQVSGNAVSDGDDDEGEDEDDGDDSDDGDNANVGLHAMFRDVRFEVKDGIVTVTNRQTGGVIFSGSLTDLASGTFYPENMPGAPGTGGGGTTTPPTAACVYTYGPWGACLSNTQTRNLLSSSPAGCTGTPVLTQPCTSVPPAPTPACGTCHAIPPGTGQHSFHVTSMGFSCDRCHGAGYSSTSVNAATHDNGVKNVVSSLNFNATTRSCSPGCHGTRSW